MAGEARVLSRNPRLRTTIFPTASRRRRRRQTEPGSREFRDRPGVSAVRVSRERARQIPDGGYADIPSFHSGSARPTFDIQYPERTYIRDFSSFRNPLPSPPPVKWIFSSRAAVR